MRGIQCADMMWYFMNVNNANSTIMTPVLAEGMGRVRSAGYFPLHIADCRNRDVRSGAVLGGSYW
jgi:hypothetical protein